jgi:putative hydrolase of the HAD superfamily
MARRCLILDGDDTLWENNIFFEEAIERFIDFLDHSSMSREQIRAALDEVERLNSRVHGYGSAAFAENLRQCYERLCERQLRAEDIEHVLSLGRRIAEQPLRLIDGVESTVSQLALRNDLILFTKGGAEEQRLKIEHSGLTSMLKDSVVVREKDREAYVQLISERSLAPERTWMVGNSPRSDINPALEAGLNAVFIPHSSTWSLELEDIIDPDGGRLLVLQRFADLRQHF